MYFMAPCLESEDNFGQTPLHLAAMKGHVAVVQTLVSKYHASTRKRDKQGYTALDHSVQKGLLFTELTLRKLTAVELGAWCVTWEVVRGLGWRRALQGRTIGQLLFGMNEREQGCWMWRIIFFSNFYATYCVFHYALSVYMSDCTSLHLLNTILHSIWWICFLSCLFKSPGFVPDVEASSEHSSVGDAVENKNSSTQQPLLTYGDFLAQGQGIEDPRTAGQRNNSAIQVIPPSSSCRHREMKEK